LIELDLELCKYLIEEVFDPEKQIETYVIAAIQKYSKAPQAPTPKNEDMPAN